MRRGEGKAGRVWLDKEASGGCNICELGGYCLFVQGMW